VSGEEFLVDHRARLSGGTSSGGIYDMVARALRARHRGGGVLLDVGCGVGNLWRVVAPMFDRYIGVDAVRYESLGPETEFYQIDVETGRIPLAENGADVVAAVETIEHVENPRALMRELTRVTRPGGWVVVTTPNQHSLLSLLTLAVKGKFSAFQDVHYPAHLSALLTGDLLRIARENSLAEVQISYSHEGRIIWTSAHFPSRLSRLFPRALSDNVLLVGRKLNG
jgi:2-polyprenyl-3-methyl-5-hydroxy-6-metoxy-1,4-benzoquinol methylase